jgi:hypothetical protein
MSEGPCTWILTELLETKWLRILFLIDTFVGGQSQNRQDSEKNDFVYRTL